MRTKVITTTLYRFEELSDKAQHRALEQLWDINVDDSYWFEGVFEGLEEFGKDSSLGCRYGGSFDCERGDFLHITDVNTSFGILLDHVEACKGFPDSYEACIAPFFARFTARETRQLLRLERREFLGMLRGETSTYRNGVRAEIERYDSYGGARTPRITALLDKLDDAWTELLWDLEHVYLWVLRNEYAYQTSEERIRETIDANEYEFTENGDLA